MRNRCGHRQHHAEAMEHRHLNHHAVCGGQIHAVADRLAVVDNVVMRQHDTLGESRRARGVLHIAHVVLVDRIGAAVQLLDGSSVRVFQRIFHRQRAVHAGLAGDDVAQEGESCAVKRLACLVRFQLGDELVNNFAVVRAFVAVYHDQRVCVGLAKQIFRLVNLVCGVDCDQNRADFGGCPERQIPCGNVGCPDCDVVALADAQRHQSARESIHVLTELRVGARIIVCRVTECILIGETVADVIQKLGESQVDQGFLGPRIFTCAAFVILQAVTDGHFAEVSAHKMHVLREYHACVKQLGHPFFDPFQRHKAFKIDGTQCVHNIVQRHVAFAHHAVGDDTVIVDRILDVDVADVSAEVLNRFFGRLAEIAVGVVNIPQCTHMLTAAAVEHRCKACGIAECTVCFDQNGHARFFRKRNQLVQL